MTRAQFMAKLQLQLELWAAQQQVRNVVAMVRQGIPADQIAACVEFGNERNAEAVMDALGQAERLLDRFVRGTPALTSARNG